MERKTKWNIPFPSTSSEYHRLYYNLCKNKINLRQNKRYRDMIIKNLIEKKEIKDIVIIKEKKEEKYKHISFSYIYNNKYLFIYNSNTNQYGVFSTICMKYMRIYPSYKNGFYYHLTIESKKKSQIIFLKDLIKCNTPLNKDFSIIGELVLEYL
tara:strand:- start:4618 stop:5079 length:462 start_codon:yes stop_codon:yes gene_type:complete